MELCALQYMYMYLVSAEFCGKWSREIGPWWTPIVLKGTLLTATVTINTGTDHNIDCLIAFASCIY